MNTHPVAVKFRDTVEAWRKRLAEACFIRFVREGEVYAHLEPEDSQKLQQAVSMMEAKP